MEFSNACFELTKQSEGCVLHAYWDQDAPSIGYGHHSGVRMGDTCTQEQADQWLQEDLQVACDAVAHFVKVPLTQGQVDGLTDFTYNVGTGNLKDSTLLKKLNSADYAGAADELLRWDKAGGVVDEDLLTRRKQERALFLGE